MKIGVMNNPAKSVYDEVTAFGEARFDFVDLTIEGPAALEIEVSKLKPILDSYAMSVTGHTDPCLPYAYPIQDCPQRLSERTGALCRDFFRPGRSRYEYPSQLFLSAGHAK